MQRAFEELGSIVGPDHLAVGEMIEERYWHDESLTVAPSRPMALVRPADTDELVELVRWAERRQVPLVVRGAGTGLAGGAVCRPTEVCVSTERLSGVDDVDTVSRVAVVRAGTSLAELDHVLADHGLRYTVSPGENAASIGGTVATNAGGMRAVRFGTTRQNVLGATVVTGGGRVLTLGGSLYKRSSGYDLLQLVIGSEGTLGIVERAILRLAPRAEEAVFVAHAPTMRGALGAVQALQSIEPPPSVIEYLEPSALEAMAHFAGVTLGLPGWALADGAILVVAVERVDADDVARAVELAGAVLEGAGADGVWVLGKTEGRAVLRAREAALWTVRALGARDIVDVVVPPARLGDYFDAVAAVASTYGVRLAATGHVGDGNVHLSVFADDVASARRVVEEVVAEGVRRGGGGVGRARHRGRQA